ncbi:MAG: helix-turn-helix transcriptional regulator [Gemmatimonas sp.]|nr:helix-turn-helix transcriptional regulator [Gemmatimonas sp.]
MRLRLPESLDAANLTAYALAKQSGERISLSIAYRLCRLKGRLESFDAAALDALCDVLGVTPGELFERESVRPTRRSVVPAVKSSKAAARGRVR